MDHAQTLDLMRRRLLWLQGKLAEYRRARETYWDIPPGLIDASRFMYPAAAFLTALQRQSADALLPFVRELHSAAVRLEDLMPGAVDLVANPPWSMPSAAIAELDGLVKAAAVQLDHTQTALSEWSNSPAYYHSGRTPWFQAYLAADPAGLRIRERYEAEIRRPVTGEAPTPRAAPGRSELPAGSPTAREREVQEQMARQIAQREQPGPGMGMLLGVAILALVWAVKKR